MLVSDIVRRNAAYFGDDDAIVVPGAQTLSWTDMERRSNQLAHALGELGLEKGDRFSTYSTNAPEYLDFFFGCAKSGVVGATTNIRLHPDELTSYLSYVQPRALLVNADMADAARGWIDQADSLEHVVGFGGAHGFDIDLDDLLGAQPDTDPGLTIDDTDTYQLGSTSGTTGVPKGAILTHRNAIASILTWCAELPMDEKGTNLQNIPLFFNPGGPAGIHPVMMTGGRSIIRPAFDPGDTLRLVPEYSVTHTTIVPTMIGMVLDHPECGDHDLSTIQGIVTGGSPVPRDLLVRAREVFGDVFFPFFGMAETYSCGMALRRENQITNGTEAGVARLASAGKPHLLMQTRVVDDDGNDVSRDNESPGEVWLRGDTVSPGYFRMPEETAASRTNGWFMSGDVAVMDLEGFITIVDRKKDMIITGGINVFTRDVEEVLYTHDAVAQVAVIGIPDDQWGEAIHAVVVLRPGAAVEPNELLAYAAKRLTSYKKPRSLDIVDELPIGGTGKILKRELRARYQPDTASDSGTT